MNSSTDIIALLESERESIRKFGVKELGVFGSFARGKQRPDSDVDVLVDLDRNSFDIYMDLLFFLEDLFGRKVDLVVKNTIKPMIRNRVLREAIYVPNL